MVRELQFHVLPKSGSVGVVHGACIAEGLKDELSCRDLRGELGALLARAADAELDDGIDGQSTVLGFSTARFTAEKRMSMPNQCMAVFLENLDDTSTSRRGNGYR